MLFELLSQLSPTTVILTGVLGSLALYWLFSLTNHKNLPPGPSGLPIVGYLPFMGSKPHQKFDQLAKKYGPVFSLYLGRTLVVVLNDYKSIKEAFSKEEFLGKPQNTIFNLMDNDYPSIVEHSGEVWKEQRRFALHVFRDLGMGRPVMEGHILDEISGIMEKFKSTNGAPYDITNSLMASMSNNITALVFGERFPPGDKRRKMMDDLFINEERGTFNMTSFPIYMTWIMDIIKKFNLFKIEEGTKRLERFRDFLKESIREHEKTIDENNIRDYIDAFIIEMKKRKGQESSFTERTLVGNGTTFFGAGSDTVYVSVTWLMLVMASHKEIQSRVHKEIDDVIGDRTPQWKDNVQMPYVNAVISEMHRWATVVPINLPRSPMKDTTVGGYLIPKGTTVFANFWSVHRDPNIWQCPETFDPERFYKKKVEMAIPFSYGKRSCPGEGLANVEVFLYFVSFMQNFTVSLPEGVKSDFDFKLEITSTPKLSTFCLTQRTK